MPATFTTAKAPRASKSGISIYADTSQLSRLARDLRLASPESWKACRASLKVVGNIVAADWRARASSWSTTVPGSIKVRVTSGGNIKVVAGGPSAPVAAPAENKGKAGTFRAPLFGDREHWYDHKAHPDGAEALAAHQGEVVELMTDAVTTAVERALDGRL